MKTKTQLLTGTAVLIAVSFVVTRFLQIPIPLGYFNVGNSVILAGCTLLPTPYGIIAGSIGPALADLTSYPVYTLPTLFIKALMALIFYAVIKSKASFGRKMLGAVLGTLIPLFGYTLVGGIIYGSLATGLAQFPGLLIEYVANLILCALLFKALEKNRFIQNNTNN